MNPRAWASVFAVCAALGLALLLAMMPRPDAAETLALCRAQAPAPGTPLACLDALAPDILVAELAGSAERWHCLVQRGLPKAAPSLDHRECAEHRTERLRGEVRGFDQVLFIPLYAGLSALLVAWAWSHARLGAPAQPQQLRAIAVVLAACTLLLVLLDLWENRRLLAVLDLLDRAGVAAWLGAAGGVDTVTLDHAARDARLASALKWLACAPWAAALAVSLHAVLRWLPAVEAPRLWRGLVMASWAAALLSAALMAVGGLAALFSTGLQLPVKTLEAGTVALIAALAGAAAAAAWGAMKRGIAFDARPSAAPPPQDRRH